MPTYHFSPAEMEILSPLFMQLDLLQSRLAGIVDLIHKQQGLDGPYRLNDSKTGLEPIQKDS